ncbi:hypothetical protein [Niabella aquatica]
MKKFYTVFLIVFIIAAFSACKKDNPGTKETIVYETGFSTDDGHWYTGTTSTNAVISIDNGYYIFKSGSAGGWDTWLNSVFNNNVSNSGIEASFKVATTGQPGWGNGGLLWNILKSANSDTYVSYYFHISHNGYYTIYGFPDGTTKKTFVDWTLNSVIKSEQFNTLKIILKNSKLHFYINNSEVYNMETISGFANLDKVGLGVSKYTNMQVDYFKAITF